MNIVIRLDISRRIGTGHLRRAQNLIAAIPEANPLYIVGTDDPANSLLRDLPMVIIRDEDEIQTIASIAAFHKAELIILDLLRYPRGYVARLKGKTALKCVSFHEYCDWDPASDLAINYNPFDGWKNEQSNFVLAGPSYCILNPAIVGMSRIPDSTGVFAYFGGSDPSGFAVEFARRITCGLPGIPFVIHTGPFNISSGLSIDVAFSSNIAWSKGEGVIFERMASCQTPVCAGGNSMYELIYLGFCPLVIAHNSHQDEFAHNMSKLGGCRYFGMHPMVDWDALRAALVESYASPELPKPIIDGCGAVRIARRIRQLL